MTVVVVLASIASKFAGILEELGEYLPRLTIYGMIIG